MVCMALVTQCSWVKAFRAKHLTRFHIHCTFHWNFCTQLIYPSPGCFKSHSIVQSYYKELGHVTGLIMAYVQRWIREVMVEENLPYKRVISLEILTYAEATWLKSLRVLCCIVIDETIPQQLSNMLCSLCTDIIYSDILNKEWKLNTFKEKK